MPSPYHYHLVQAGTHGSLSPNSGSRICEIDCGLGFDGVQDSAARHCSGSTLPTSLGDVLPLRPLPPQTLSRLPWSAPYLPQACSPAILLQLASTDMLELICRVPFDENCQKHLIGSAIAYDGHGSFCFKILWLLSFWYQHCKPSYYQNSTTPCTRGRPKLRLCKLAAYSAWLGAKFCLANITPLTPVRSSQLASRDQFATQTSTWSDSSRRYFCLVPGGDKDTVSTQLEIWAETLTYPLTRTSTLQVRHTSARRDVWFERDGINHQLIAWTKFCIGMPAASIDWLSI